MASSLARISVLWSKEGSLSVEGEKVDLAVDTSVRMVDLVVQLQDRLRLRDTKDDLTFCAVTSANGDVKWLNANFSLLNQSFSPADDVLVVVPLKSVPTILAERAKQASAKRATLNRGSLRGPSGGGGSAPSTPTLRRAAGGGGSGGGGLGGGGGGLGGGLGGGGGSEELKGVHQWVMKWSVKGSKIASKSKTFAQIKKNFVLYGSSEKGPAKGAVPLDLYNAERISPTQIDLVPSGEGWVLAKGVIRPQVCFGFDNAAMADKFYDELTKKTCRGTWQRQFGVPMWYFDARGEVLPQVFLDCVRYIYNNCLSTPEIFRQGGDADDVKFLRSEYNNGNVPSLDKITDPHTVAALFKAWLSELPQPLLTYTFFSEFMTAMKLSEQQRLQALQNSIAKIPSLNQRVLWICTQLWKLVHDQNESNFMHAGNLSVVFAPKVIHPKTDINITYKTQPLFNQITEILILQGDSIFTTALHSTPPEWSFILDPERAPVSSPARKPTVPTIAPIPQVSTPSLQVPSSNNSNLVTSAPAVMQAPVAAAARPVSMTLGGATTQGGLSRASGTTLPSPRGVIGSAPPPMGVPPQLAAPPSGIPPPPGVPAGIPPPPQAVPSGLPPPPGVPSGLPPPPGVPSGLPPPPGVPAGIPPPPTALPSGLPPPPIVPAGIPPPPGVVPSGLPPPPQAAPRGAPQITQLPPPINLPPPPGALPPATPKAPSASPPTMASLQAENERLQAEVARLKAELAQKDAIIASLRR